MGMPPLPAMSPDSPQFIQFMGDITCFEKENIDTEKMTTE